MEIVTGQNNLKKESQSEMQIPGLFSFFKLFGFSKIEAGWQPQQARSVLPNSLKTEIVVTANLREWRTIFKQRTAIAAHPQMREIMCPLLDELKIKLPSVFNDINY
jgi:thymidylate synthase ThyX